MDGDVLTSTALLASDSCESGISAWLGAVRKGLSFEWDYPGGRMTRDVIVPVDDDGKAYPVFLRKRIPSCISARQMLYRAPGPL